MSQFIAGEEVTVKGVVLRTRDSRVELQLGDGQLLRVPTALAIRKTEEKAVEKAPANKAVTRAPENKGGGPKDNGRGANDSTKR